MDSVYFPSVRGKIGDWIYYTSVMPIQELADRVDFVKDVHKTSALSEILQRDIRKKREIEISNYLAQNNERFFNSLVLAVYDNHPEWFPASVSSKQINDLNNVQGEVGLLEFTGEEKIIPIDGQHRLAGIKSLLKRYRSNEIIPDHKYSFLDDIIPVIFIAHRKDSEKNRLRTRRLFTTLNKYAVKVNRYEIISLDEDDPMAITTRWLVENDDRFKEGRIKFKGGANISVDDGALTTIENIYDILTILFTTVYQKARRSSLTTCLRPKDIELKKYREHALQFFDCLAENYKEIKNYFQKSKYENYAKEKRQNGHVLFRPVGLKLIANLIAKSDATSVEDKFRQINGIPINLNSPPYFGLLISKQGTMQDSNEAKARNLLLGALGIELNKTEIKSAKAGLSIIKEVPQSNIRDKDIPTTLEKLMQL